MWTIAWATTVSRPGTHLASFISRISRWSPASWAARVPLEELGVTSVLFMARYWAVGLDHLSSPMFLEHTGFHAYWGKALPKCPKDQPMSPV